MIGLSTSGSISLGIDLVAGKKRVPKPAAGKTALRTLLFIVLFDSSFPSVLRLPTATEDSIEHLSGCLPAYPSGFGNCAPPLCNLLRMHLSAPAAAVRRSRRSTTSARFVPLRRLVAL